MTDIYKYCSETDDIPTMMYRSYFLSRIYGIKDMPDIVLKPLPDWVVSRIKEMPYTDTIGRIFILFGGGYLDDSIFEKLINDTEKYKNEILTIENLAISLSDNTNLDKTMFQELLLCVINSLKHEEIQRINIDTAKQIYNNPYIMMKYGKVFINDKKLIDIVSEYKLRVGKNGKTEDDIEVIQPEDFAKEYENQYECARKVAEMGHCEPMDVYSLYFVLDLRILSYILTIYPKAYCKEFVLYCKENSIPLDDNISAAYESFVEQQKFTFRIKRYKRKRKICGSRVNWFDYDPRNQKNDDTSETVNLLNDLCGEDKENIKEFKDKDLIGKCLEKICHVMCPPDSVVELFHEDKCMVFHFLPSGNNEYEEIKSEDFHKTLFDFDNIWKTIQGWSAKRKIVKTKNNEGKFVITINPESEWNLIPQSERPYAERILEEQCCLNEEKLKNNGMMRTLDKLRKDSMKNSEQAQIENDITGRNNEEGNS